MAFTFFSAHASQHIISGFFQPFFIHNALSRQCKFFQILSDTLSSSWCTSLPKRFSINSRLSDPSRWQCNSILGNAISCSCVVMFLHFVFRIYFSKCFEKGFMPGSLDRIPVAAALSGYKYHNVPYPLPKQS